MFKKNEYVMYEAAGVCQVQKVDYPEFLKGQERKYYFLKPLHSMCDNIFVPVDNENRMRRILTKEEAKELIEKIPDIQTECMEDDKSSEESYKKVIQSYDCYELVKLTKNLYLRCSQRRKEGKKPLQVDERYLNTAEEYLFGELSVALDIPISKVSQYITRKVEEARMEC